MQAWNWSFAQESLPLFNQVVYRPLCSSTGIYNDDYLTLVCSSWC